MSDLHSTGEKLHFFPKCPSVVCLCTQVIHSVTYVASTNFRSAEIAVDAAICIYLKNMCTMKLF